MTTRARMWIIIAVSIFLLACGPADKVGQAAGDSLFDWLVNITQGK